MEEKYRNSTDTIQIIWKLLSNSQVMLSRAQIAKALGRKKSPHLILLLEEMVKKGWLEKQEYYYRGNSKIYYYGAAIVNVETES